MKGVAVSVAPDLAIYDLTHEIPAYNIWEAALRLDQSASYWPPGTVFVSVVDPGVGSERHSVVLKTRSGHYFVTPDNGTLTFVAESLGVEQVREIDEKANRLSRSGDSYTFHGRDVYAYTAARLASGVITFTEVGPDRGQEIVRIPYQRRGFREGHIAGWNSHIGYSIWKRLDQYRSGDVSATGRGQRRTVGGADICRRRVAGAGGINLCGYFCRRSCSVSHCCTSTVSVTSPSLSTRGDFAQSTALPHGPDWNVRITAGWAQAGRRTGEYMRAREQWPGAGIIPMCGMIKVLGHAPV